jgi:hypothetical protein
MAPIFGALAGLFGGGAAAGTAAAGAAAGAGAAATTGLTISSVLEGVATVGGLVMSIASGAAQKEQADAAADDADRQQSLENLEGINRRRSLKQAATDAIGAQDVAYAASGVDLSFGTASQARTEAFREADLGLASDVGTQQTRIARLQERAASYRQMGKRALLGGIIGGITGAAEGFGRIIGRGSQSTTGAL